MPNMWGYDPTPICNPTSGAKIAEHRQFSGHATINNPITGETLAVHRTVGGREVISHPITGATIAEVRR